MENTPANCRHHSTSLAVNRYIRLAKSTFALSDPDNYGMPQIHSGLRNGFGKASTLVSEMLEEMFLLQSGGATSTALGFFSSNMEKKTRSLSSELRSMFGGAAFVSCLLCVQSTAIALKPESCAARVTPADPAKTSTKTSLSHHQCSSKTIGAPDSGFSSGLGT